MAWKFAQARFRCFFKILKILLFFLKFVHYLGCTRKESAVYFLTMKAFTRFTSLLASGSDIQQSCDGPISSCIT